MMVALARKDMVDDQKVVNMLTTVDATFPKICVGHMEPDHNIFKQCGHIRLQPSTRVS
jgi:hypothetical protein